MSTTAIEPSVLESLDFDITCQTQRAYFFMGVKLDEQPNCHRPATHSASIHQVADCASIDKFVCSECIGLLANDKCLNCTETCRVSNVVPLPKAS